jgi:hypothetical protein
MRARCPRRFSVRHVYKAALIAFLKTLWRMDEAPLTVVSPEIRRHAISTADRRMLTASAC